MWMEVGKLASIRHLLSPTLRYLSRITGIVGLIGHEVANNMTYVK